MSTLHATWRLVSPGRLLAVLPPVLVVLPGLAIVRGLAALVSQGQPPTTLAGAGYAMAFVSLAMGALLFAYASRYYVATLLVLLTTSARARDNGGGNGAGLSRIAHKARSGNGHGDEPEVEGAPFVSIHIATYNEKRVLERLLECCAAFEYPNYEVVLVDDSTDESGEILERWRDRPRFKILHRTSRRGYKGGALKEALRLTDPRAEYVVVFDADAMPFPDSLQRFLPHFYRMDRRRGLVARPRVGAVQSYQWHVLNKSESWLTAAVRAEYAGSYMVERVYQDDVGAMKMVAGMAYMIRADLLRQLGWGTSITEDWELTLRLYRRGYQVVYTPHAEAPAECVATFGRLVRQRMRWAEGHCHNVRRHFVGVMTSPWVSPGEKLEFLYYAGYYLQGLFFLLGTLSWLGAEIGFREHVPEWTATLGWSLLFTNLLSLPLMNASGLVLEEAERKDLGGVLGAVLVSYLLVPFQAWAALSGYLEVIEGPWFRTPKTGVITDEVRHLRRLRKIRRWLLQRANGQGNGNGNGNGNGHHIRATPGPPRRPSSRAGWAVVAAMALALGGWGLLARTAPTTAEAAGTNNFYLHGASSFTMDETSPTGANQTFAMTAANATRTWATTTTTAASQTIAAGSTLHLNYWTTGTGTASTNLTFGHSANAGCAASIAQVQQGTSVHSTASASATLTLPAASTAGNLLVATVSSSGTVTVSTGATGWTQAIAKQGNGGTTTIWYSQNAASTSSVTFSVSSGLDIVGQLSEWSGAATSGALDATGSTSTTNQLAPTVTTGTSLTTSGELGITAWETSSTETGGYTAGSGWTHLYSDPTPSAGHGTVADYTIGLASGATASETETAAIAEKWSAAIATFVPASSSSTTIAQATSVTLSSGSNLTTANFSPASSVTVPAGSFFCLTILVNSVAGGGVTLSYDAAASATNLVCNPAITISGGGLSGVQWQVSSTQTSATGVTYVFLFTLGSTDAISSVRVTLPSGTTGSSLTVNAVYGLGAGSASLSGTTLTYTLTTPLTVAGGTPAYLSISGFGNTGTTGAATATVADWNATSQLESGTASVTFASTGTNTTTPTSRSLTFTNDTASWQIQMDPGVAALADQSRTITLTVKSNARSGYSMNVKDAGLSTTAPVKTIAPVTAGMATGVASASFPVDALGYSATVSSPGGSGLALQGAGLSGGKLVGFTTAGEVPFAATGSTAGSADTIAMTVRVRISYATVSGVYSDTITYAVSPSY